jgi:hypothetical protein
MSALNLTQLAFRFGTCALCGAIVLAATSAIHAALPSTRPATQQILHVPDDPSQAKAERMVREVFAKEYAATELAARRALAARMLRQAMESGDDPPARFVLLREARDVAASAGDAATANRAIRVMAQFFAIDSTRVLLAAMNTSHAAAPTAEAQALVAQICLSAVDGAMVQDDFAMATKLVATAEAAAGKAKNVPLVTQARERARTLQLTLLEFQSVEKAREVLRDDRENPEACTRVGKFLCLHKGEWSAGLPLLAKGSESAIRSMARDDLAATSDPQKRLAAAEGWWELSQNQSQPIRKHLRARAAYWYELALPQLNGFHRAIAMKRLETVELDGMREQNLFPGLAAELFKGIDFARAIKTRVDEQINFDWGNEAADESLTKDNFSLRWSGVIKAPAEGSYELIVLANTGVRIWIDEKLVLENSNLARLRNGIRVPVRLGAQLHPIRIEYWDTSGLARMKLMWRRPGVATDEIVPASVFFHDPTMIPAAMEQK